MNTKELFSNILIKNQIGVLPSIVKNITTDSRNVEIGTVFVCIKGYTVNGHDYIDNAIQSGATVIVIDEVQQLYDPKVAYVVVSDTAKIIGHLASKWYGFPSKQIQLFGVTGTNGKTTVSGILFQVLRMFNEKVALTGTIGFRLNDTLYDSNNTTSEVLTTQQMIHRAVNEGCNSMMMEVSSHGLVLGRLSGVEFDVAIFTNLTHDHLDFHGTMVEYGHAKSLLFSQLGQDLTQQKYGVVNADDPFSDKLKEATPYTCFTYAIEQHADFRAVNIQLEKQTTTFTMQTPKGDFPITIQLVGMFNVYNALAVTAALYAKGYPLVEVVSFLQKVVPITGRMERLETNSPVSVYIDYAHTPDAIEKAIAAVKPTLQDGKLIFVIGTGGNRDRSKRPIMAEKASVADYVVLTTDDPRFEEYDSILDELKVGMKHNNFACIGDREEAVRHAVAVAEAGDTIIFAGKGHENYQIIGNEKTPHSDGEIALAALAEKFAAKRS